MATHREERAMQPPATAQEPERRIAPRRQPAIGTVYRLDSDDGGPSLVLLVWNISLSGVSLLSPSTRTAGTELSGFLERTEGTEQVRIAVRVVHAKLLETGDYYLGCQFAHPLAADELKLFVV
jgi:hypothetical protein